MSVERVNEMRSLFIKSNSVCCWSSFPAGWDRDGVRFTGREFPRWDRRHWMTPDVCNSKNTFVFLKNCEAEQSKKSNNLSGDSFDFRQPFDTVKGRRFLLVCKNNETDANLRAAYRRYFIYSWRMRLNGCGQQQPISGNSVTPLNMAWIYMGCNLSRTLANIGMCA